MGVSGRRHAPAVLYPRGKDPDVLAASIIRAMSKEAATTSETLVNFYQTTRRYNPGDSHLQMNPLCILRPPIFHITLPGKKLVPQITSSSRFSD
jgi:hypothetical protein